MKTTIIDNRGKGCFDIKTKKDGWEEDVHIIMDMDMDEKYEWVVEVSKTGIQIYKILNKKYENNNI